MIFSFCVGQHESKRSLPVTADAVQRAHESNVWDSLYTSIPLLLTDDLRSMTC